MQIFFTKKFQAKPKEKKIYLSSEITIYTFLWSSESKLKTKSLFRTKFTQNRRYLARVYIVRIEIIFFTKYVHVSVLKLDYFVNLLLCKLKYEWKIWMKRDTQWKTQYSNFQTSVSKSFLIFYTKYVFFHVQIGGLVQNYCAICVKKGYFTLKNWCV